jgi:tetratricopeptide (TPR) repeat protein
MGNFLDKTFTVLADILLKLLPATKQEKKAFAYYRAGMAAQSKGRLVEALKNYFEALELEEDPYDRSYILYNIGLVNQRLGKYKYAIEYYHQALVFNPNLPQALNNIGTIYTYQGHRADVEGYDELSKELFDKGAVYFKQALKLAPDNYPKVRNYLKVTGRLDSDDSI